MDCPRNNLIARIVENSSESKLRKVLLYNPSLEPGGIERTLFNVSNMLAESDVQVYLVTTAFNDVFKTDLDNRVVIVELNKEFSPSKFLKIFLHHRSQRAFVSFFAYAKAANKIRPDAVITFQAGVIAALAHMLSWRKSKLIIRESNTPSKAVVSKSALYRRIKLFAKYLSYCISDHIIAISERSKRDIVEAFRIRDSKISVIYNPTATKKLTELGFDNQIVQYRSPPTVSFVAVGRLEYQKDFATLLEAFSIASLQINAELVVIGDGSEKAMLTKLAYKLGLGDSVTFAGFLANPYPEMRAADVFVLSPRYEGLGNVFIEALALGTPVIATDCESGPSEILLDGKAGLLVKVSDPKGLAEAIVKYANDKVLREKHLSHGAEFSVPRFTPAVVAKQYLELV